MANVTGSWGGGEKLLALHRPTHAPHTPHTRPTHAPRCVLLSAPGAWHAEIGAVNSILCPVRSALSRPGGPGEAGNSGDAGAMPSRKRKAKVQ